MKKSGLLILICTVFISSCANNMDSIMSDYNDNYVYVTEVTPDPVPGDADFYEEDMLLLNYTVDMKSTLNLIAPDKCSSYSWKLYKVDDNGKETEEVVFTGNNALSTASQRYFIMYIPDERNITAGTYKMVLKVTGNDKKNYSDDCGIVFCRYLY